MLNVLNPFDKSQPFPEPETALAEPDGLLAVGGCLSLERLENAYRNGIFPWFSDNEPILWWSPDPRLVLFPERLKVARSLSKRLKRGEFQFSIDCCFENVVAACAKPRPGSGGTWITTGMRAAYVDLHEHGLAHSFETWRDGELVGGLYGVAMGQVFFGESMFHRTTDASKAALWYACDNLLRWGYRLIDCQVHSDHLSSLGAESMGRTEFLYRLKGLCDQPVLPDSWSLGEPKP